MSQYGVAKGWRHIEKRDCDPQERQNQCLWDELIFLHHFAQWKVVLLLWQKRPVAMWMCSALVQSWKEPSGSWITVIHTHPTRVQCPAVLIGSQALCWWDHGNTSLHDHIGDTAQSPTWAGRIHGHKVAYSRLQLCHSPLFN